MPVNSVLVILVYPGITSLGPRPSLATLDVLHHQSDAIHQHDAIHRVL